MHAHNTFPLISPSLYWAASRLGVPVVQTLHNFRLLCPQATFLRQGRVCEDCLGHLPWRGIVRRCYRDSMAQSTVLTAMLALHRGIGSYDRRVAIYVALNRFCRDKFVAGGLPADRLRIKPNFVDLPPSPETGARAGGLYVGRLSPEKGIELLCAAQRRSSACNVAVIGDGPLEATVRGVPGIDHLGWLEPPRVVERMQRASFLVLPSLCYESFPRTLVEAFASGLPVIASRLGAMAELIEDGRSGLLFEPGSAVDLADKMGWAAGHPAEMRRMGANARAVYEARYTPQRNYESLMEIYREALSAAAGVADAA